MHDVSYRNSHNHINRGALYIMGNGENFKIIPKEIYFYKANQPTSFSWIKVSCEKEEIGVQIDETSLKSPLTSLYFYLKSHIFEHLQHTMEKNSTSRSGTTSNLYCLFWVTMIKLCQCWVPSQVDVTLRYSILLLPPFATSFLSYSSHRKHFLSCGFSLLGFFCV